MRMTKCVMSNKKTSSNLNMNKKIYSLINLIIYRELMVF